MTSLVISSESYQCFIYRWIHTWMTQHDWWPIHVKPIKGSWESFVELVCTLLLPSLALQIVSWNNKKDHFTCHCWRHCLLNKAKGKSAIAVRPKPKVEDGRVESPDARNTAQVGPRVSFPMCTDKQRRIRINRSVKNKKQQLHLEETEALFTRGDLW